MVHMKISKKCGGELEHSLRSRSLEACSTEEYINALENIVTRNQIGRKLKRLDVQSPNKPFLKKYKLRELFKPNKYNTHEETKCHRCGDFGDLDNDCLKKAKIKQIVETEDHNDKEGESFSEKENKELDKSENDEINLINSRINNFDLTYEVLDVNSN
ncbi:hypothetical protein O181_028639 [Austropuccinia psidii MF-1]|uniref:Uncharacterized protein n=1 Tax=Austropuccinia psidii MF-1 TaxID=1389203 RepID=A0A9Q3CPB8_9BASI|nr:hypothetical protein [Austropuccinia psidii MF-1]